MKHILAIILAFISGIPLGLYRGFVVDYAWRLFVEDQFGVMSPGVVAFWGISLMLSLLVPGTDADAEAIDQSIKTECPFGKLINVIVRGFVHTTCFWGSLFVASQFL